MDVHYEFDEISLIVGDRSISLSLQLSISVAMTDKVRSIETIVEKADVEEGNAARFLDLKELFRYIICVHTVIPPIHLSTCWKTLIRCNARETRWLSTNDLCSHCRAKNCHRKSSCIYSVSMISRNR